MPLITDYKAVMDVYAEAAGLGIALPAFCCEDRETLEGILASSLKIGDKIGVDDLPVIPAWTCRYPPRGQMSLLPACGDTVLGTRMMFSDLEMFMGETSPYRKLRVLPHLDHGFPWLDSDIMEMFADKFATIMYDASEKPFEENMRMTAAYVEKVKGKVVVEGAVDEIFEYSGGEQKNEPTTVKQAKKFLSETGVEIIVPNVGTEHRATADQVKYRSDRAKEISEAVGKIMCLHGTSSVKPEDLPKLCDDGFVKINVYTTLAVNGGQAVARNVLGNLSNIFDQQQLEKLVTDGVLGQKVLDSEMPAKPKLAIVANPPRRDAWFEAVRDRCCDFLEVFNYRKFKK
ncbi:class II fructose-bisphosphate aldolase [Planctomycetota bacterium]